MPDLTIKPVAAAGNKLILQDQAGGSVLTTGDSGVTAGSTILATKTGTETLTNKTLTTPTLNTPTIASMTNCTFPAGHVLQTKHYTSTISNGTSTNVEPSPTAGISLGYDHITPLKANSLIWITAHYSYNFSRVANFQCVLWWVGYKIGSGNQSGTFTQWRRYFSDYDGVDDGSDDKYRHPTLNVIHDPTYTLGQTVSYEWKLGAGRGSGSVGYPNVMARNDAGGTNPPPWIGVQEIAQ